MRQKPDLSACSASKSPPSDSQGRVSPRKTAVGLEGESAALVLGTGDLGWREGIGERDLRLNAKVILT